MAIRALGAGSVAARSLFEELWERQTTIEVEGEMVDLLALPDPVRAKKTQRDKNWPMIRRLVEQSFYGAAEPTEHLVEFWLAEPRSPELLLEVARRYPNVAARNGRDVVRAALGGDVAVVEERLEAEQRPERGNTDDATVEGDGRRL